MIHMENNQKRQPLIKIKKKVNESILDVRRLKVNEMAEVILKKVFLLSIINEKVCTRWLPLIMQSKQ